MERPERHPETERPPLQAPPVDGAAPGSVTQDDPLYPDYYPTVVGGDEDHLTLVAVFANIAQASACARDLERMGYEVGLVARRGDGPEQASQPGNLLTEAANGLTGNTQPVPKENPMGAGVAVGATIGATTGLMAATYFMPPFGAAFATGSLVGTLVGAGLGSFFGGLVEYGVADHNEDAATKLGQVRQGGVILLTRVGAGEADAARRRIGIWHPLEIRAH